MKEEVKKDKVTNKKQLRKKEIKWQTGTEERLSGNKIKREKKKQTYNRIETKAKFAQETRINRKNNRKNDNNKKILQTQCGGIWGWNKNASRQGIKKTWKEALKQCKRRLLTTGKK